VDVKKVALEEMANASLSRPCGLLLVIIAADHSELKRDLYTANFVFIFKSPCAQRIDPHQSSRNERHLLREDQAFK